MDNATLLLDPEAGHEPLIEIPDFVTDAASNDLAREYSPRPMLRRLAGFLARLILSEPIPSSEPTKGTWWV